MTRVTGKVLRNSNNGRMYGCKECTNNDHVDDCVVLFTVDTDYHMLLEYAQQMTGEEGHLEVTRDLYGAYPYARNVIEGNSVRHG